MSGQFDEVGAVALEVFSGGAHTAAEIYTVEHDEIRARTYREDPEAKVDGWKMNE